MYFIQSTLYNVHTVHHRVDRVLGLFSSRPIWAPHPLTRKRVCPPPLVPRGETHSLAGEGLGGPNSDEGTDTVVLLVYMYFELYTLNFLTFCESFRFWNHM
jgi:hypothetical protein